MVCSFAHLMRSLRKHSLDRTGCGHDTRNSVVRGISHLFFAELSLVIQWEHKKHSCMSHLYLSELYSVLQPFRTWLNHLMPQGRRPPQPTASILCVKYFRFSGLGREWLQAGEQMRKKEETMKLCQR